MTTLPRITGKKLLKALNKTGFDVIRVKGSHYFLKHPDGRITVVPVHQGETLGPGILSQILKDVEMSALELKNLL